MFYGVGDQFSDMYDSITGDDKAKIEEAKPQLDTAKVSEQIKSSLGEVKKPEEGGISMANEALKDVKTTISAAEETKKQPATAEAPADSNKAEGPQPITQTATLNDVYDILVQLNSNIVRMTAHTESINNASNKQIRETQKLSGNRFG